MGRRYEFKKAEGMLIVTSLTTDNRTYLKTFYNLNILKEHACSTERYLVRGLCNTHAIYFYATDNAQEVIAEIAEWLSNKYEAQYFIHKCIDTRADTTIINIDGLRLLCQGRDSGIETIFERYPSIAGKLDIRKWKILDKKTKRKYINIIFNLDDRMRRSIRGISTLERLAEDKDYILRTRCNRGLPDVCKLTAKDIKWLRKHKEDTAYGRRKTTTELNFFKRYTKYLEYEYTRERDVTDEYWRYNRDWVRILKEEEAIRRQLAMQGIQTQIAEYYKNKVKPKDMIEGFTFEVSDKYSVWKQQASKLHQCILSCRYYARTKSTIILCTKDDEPYATFEVRDSKIIQSYKDEASDDTRVEDVCTEACIKYITKYNI